VNFTHGETVTILHPAASGTDEYGGAATTTWTAEDVPNCGVEPRFSTEDNVNQSTVAVGLTVFLPPDALVETTARLIVRDVEYEVIGEPADWRSPFTGWRPGLSVALERAQ
jgi:hypothetical protein